MTTFCDENGNWVTVFSIDASTKSSRPATEDEILAAQIEPTPTLNVVYEVDGKSYEVRRFDESTTVSVPVDPVPEPEKPKKKREA